jgi:hypothetical protein
VTITAHGYGMTDDAILRYLPAVRQALAARERSRNAPGRS